MGLNALLGLLVGTGGVLLMIAALRVAVGPRRLWASWFQVERRWRRRRFGGDWTPLERSLRRLGYFWVPRDVELRRPDDVYAYALSDRFWRSGYAWFVRALCWYAALLLLFFGLAVLGVAVPSLS